MSTGGINWILMAYSVCPQVVMVNGYGQLHDRLCGSASQLGVQSGYATIGVAKSLLHSSQLQLNAEFDTWCHTSQPADSSDGQQHPPPGSTQQHDTGSLAQKAIGSSCQNSQQTDAHATQTPHIEDAQHRNLVYPLHSQAGLVLGAGVQANHHSRRPVFVSVGHRVSLATAIAVTQACCRHR